MIQWLIARWHARLRRIDIEILWPICREAAVDLDHARAAFATHAFIDRAWKPLGEQRIKELIDKLS